MQLDFSLSQINVLRYVVKNFVFAQKTTPEPDRIIDNQELRKLADFCDKLYATWSVPKTVDIDPQTLYALQKAIDYIYRDFDDDPNSDWYNAKSKVDQYVNTMKEIDKDTGATEQQDITSI